MLKVMVVDDEPDVKLLFEQRFRKEVREGEVQMFFAFSGEEALQQLTAGPAADVVLILSDINMPDMSGLELLRRIKETRVDLKVFMITAYNDEENHRRAMEYGADEYLTKPIDFDELKVRIHRLEHD